MRMVSTLFASNPGATARNANDVRMRSPDPITSVSASATSRTTSAERTRLLRPPPDEPVPSLSVPLRSSRAACSAGITPKSSPVPIETIAVNANNRQSS